MLKDWFLEFSPRHSVPLIVEFISFAKEKGFSSGIRFDSWDFELYDSSESPVMVVKSIKNRITPKNLEQILREETPMKVFLAEGANFSDENLAGNRVFLATTGAGVFVRGRGWLVLPGRPSMEEIGDLRLKMSKKWHQDEEGNWWKKCSKCGNSYPPRGFYRNYRNNTRDPYQARCKACWSNDNAEAHARRLGRLARQESTPSQSEA